MHKRLRWALSWFVVPVVLFAIPVWIAFVALDRTPLEHFRYVEGMLESHPEASAATLPLWHSLRPFIERAPPAQSLPSLGKGASPEAGRVQTDGDAGGPQSRNPEPAPSRSRTITIKPGDDIATAFAAARPGSVIAFAPGRHRLDRKIQTSVAGTVSEPVTVRADRAGEAVIEVLPEEALRVTQPFWIFENLTFAGACAKDNDCEHALHVVGRARNTIVRNMTLRDFNAAVKVNGEDGFWPDAGRIQFSTFSNTRVRDVSERSVVPIDLVGANDWHITDNLINNFVKLGGNRVSFGIFMKGGGKGGRIERNLIVCSSDPRLPPGQRIGISFGGGGTAPDHCRDGRCTTEHSEGIIANNVVAHCNDSGIDINNSTQITIAFNTLVNTGGIDLRRQAVSASAYGNLLEGRIRARDGAWLAESHNSVGALARMLSAPDALDLAWRQVPAPVPRLDSVATDFCGAPRAALTLPGAVGSKHHCAETAPDRAPPK